MDKGALEKLRKKYELATSDVYQEIRKEILNFILNHSNKDSIITERVMGMLMVVNEIDKWVKNYNKALEERKDN